MILHWPTGEQTDISNINPYRVANTPVQLSLSFYNSMKIGDAYAFSEDIKILPRMKPNRPLELWQITMRDSQGEVVFSQTGLSGNAAERFPYNRPQIVELCHRIYQQRYGIHVLKLTQVVCGVASHLVRLSRTRQHLAQFDSGLFSADGT